VSSESIASHNAATANPNAVNENKTIKHKQIHVPQFRPDFFFVFVFFNVLVVTFRWLCAIGGDKVVCVNGVGVMYVWGVLLTPRDNGVTDCRF